MKFGLLALALAHAHISSALILPFKQARRSAPVRRSGLTSVHTVQPPKGIKNLKVFAASGQSSGSNLDLDTVHDLLYMANVTVGGRDYPIQLDTGSSDLWIKGPSSPLPNAEVTTIDYNLTYGIGWAYGHVAYADVEFANIGVKKQAYLDVSSAQNPALSYGAVGILGLGFTSLSTVDALVNRSGADTGRSLLYNLFEDNPSEPNFIAFALQRSTHADNEVEGSFSIGEYEPDYAHVAENPAIPTFPPTSPKRWNILLDALLFPDRSVIPNTTVSGAPGGRAVILLDSGTSYTYAPKEICDEIYANVPGAKYDPSMGQWVVPCSAEISIALQINGQVFPIHPLDVTPAGLVDPSQCVGSFVPQTVSVGSGEFDWLVGDNILRSIYSVYDFGDFDDSGKMGNPYVKLLSLTDANKASVEFHKVRGGAARNDISFTAANVGASDGSTTITLSAKLADTLDKVGKYFPAMLGVVALNALVLLGLIVLGIVFLCKKKKRRSAAPARTPLGRLTPMPMDGQQLSDRGSSRHMYEPVSMALTEDTMMVTSPGFKVFDGDVIRPADRPMSMMPSNSQSSTQPFPVSSSGADAVDDNIFLPPSPAFKSRPRSVA
ncbi:hypothetical protein PLEOSDRAFT_1112018 [Pleurotus ostreatus PC15]|uniref:Peptidase A1 domain-containing protein n=1 Tax=Pleurotus ostreatus (strain PC15) TaxID=1137138 RepID=A0A067NZB0_PLEO1|nr:hypothetical protein PLEOSDRAFT_1112018 [Pleurotus ostreatus PC15]